MKVEIVMTNGKSFSIESDDDYNELILAFCDTKSRFVSFGQSDKHVTKKRTFLNKSKISHFICED
jgi:hypothetical protein